MNYNSLLACDLMSGTGFLGLMYIAFLKNLVGLDLCVLLYLFIGLGVYFYGRIMQNQIYYEKRPESASISLRRFEKS